MFEKILIANRGEIALRIIRAAKELGVKTVAIYSEADRDSLHVRFADEAICIGPPPPNKSYLDIPRIISAAEVSGADAIHPGYGFLAENARFAEVCEDNKIVFIGPSPKHIEMMGDKAVARNRMEKAGVPVIPGSKGIISNVEEGQEIAKRIGYPVMIKATGGGGGKGMRMARDKREFETGFRMAQTEAEASFGDKRVYIEKLLLKPRHIEFQVLGDKYGSAVHLGERECSIQRRHQKLIEESPSPAMNEQIRRKIGKIAVKGVSSIGYNSAGTMEFLMDEKKHFYFMEMNTRIQVEHPVTEFVTGIDIVKKQIEVAAGEKLNLSQRDIDMKGHAIEVRVNAEDPEKFIPSAGKITALHIPGGPGVRIDTHIYQEYFVPPNYDSLLAKVITYGNSRKESIERMRRVLDELVIEGIKTTIPFHKKVMEHPDFIMGNIDTGFIERMNL